MLYRHISIDYYYFARKNYHLRACFWAVLCSWRHRICTNDIYSAKLTDFSCIRHWWIWYGGKDTNVLFTTFILVTSISDATRHDIMTLKCFLHCLRLVWALYRWSHDGACKAGTWSYFVVTQAFLEQVFQQKVGLPVNSKELYLTWHHCNINNHM